MEALRDIATLLAPSAAVWMAVKVSLNGTSQRVRDIALKLDDVQTRLIKLEERQSREEKRVHLD
jgi:hypothetical protein